MTPVPTYNRDGITLYHGDCREVMPTFAADSFDAVVTDPPAGIGFMGKDWDRFGGRGNPRAEQDRAAAKGRGPISARNPHGKDTQPFGYSGSAICNPGQRAAFVAFLSGALAECLRVAKPGARLLCWSIPRTSHWTGTAIEDAGWIIEDRLAHIFGQGFPKSKSKLKPAVEDWWLARKPGRVVPELNIDLCRITAPDGLTSGGRCVGSSPNPMSRATGLAEDRDRSPEHPAGRWPANLVLSHHPDCREVGTRRVKSSGDRGSSTRSHAGLMNGTSEPRPTEGTGYADPDGLETVSAWACVEGCPVAELDRQSGELSSGKVAPHHMRQASQQANGGGYHGRFRDVPLSGYGDSGGASRFFYCPKASRSDRGEDNRHPTVKNTELMRWLCRLITPLGGTILDPFAGSGSTLLAAYYEGFDAMGIEREPEYHATAEARLAEARAATPLFSEVERTTA